MKSTLSWLQRLVSSQYKEDAKVMVMVVMAAHFIITSFLVTFFAFYLVLYTPKGAVNTTLIELLKNILENDFWIIVAGFGFISTVDFGQAMIQKAVATARGPAPITIENAEAVTSTTKAETVNTENIENVSTNTTNNSNTHSTTPTTTEEPQDL